jgi:hypothetical protein
MGYLDLDQFDAWIRRAMIVRTVDELLEARTVATRMANRRAPGLN